MSKSNPYPFIPDPFMPPHEDDIELKVVLFNYLKYWPFIVTCTLVCVLAAFLFNKYATPVYLVQSSVIITEEPQPLGSEIFDAVGMMPIKNNVENEIGILKSYTLAEEAILELGLDVFYFTDDLLSSIQVHSGVPVKVDVDWTHPQLVKGKFVIEVLDNQTFSIEPDGDDFEIFNPSDPFYKQEINDIPELKPVYAFGENIESEFLKIKIESIDAKEGDRIFFQLVDTPSLALFLK